MNLLLAHAAAAAVLSQSPVAAPSITGAWSGPIQTPEGDLGVVICAAESASGLTAVMEVPDQGLPAPLRLSVKDGGPKRLTFSAPQIGASFEADWNESAQAWTGVWSQSGLQLPLVLKRSAATCRPGA